MRSGSTLHGSVTLLICQQSAPAHLSSITGLQCQPGPLSNCALQEFLVKWPIQESAAAAGGGRRR